MNITLKLYASLMPYLPETNQRHAVDIEINADQSPYEVIDEVGIPRELAHLVIVNGYFICGDERNVGQFKEGDVLAIWPEVAGG
ncbi:MAG: hypothetical protein V3V09_01020 [Arenicellales bacterium]